MVQAGGTGARKVGSSGAEHRSSYVDILTAGYGNRHYSHHLWIDAYQQRESFQRLTDLVHTAVSGTQHWRREELEREASFVQ